ncbi:MAG: cation-transporting P-type ATPase [Brasilonema angustatum HA4187-MV1]|jgi:Ca2+-transporting ATPase|nr:cation-transporting P-type ATPase [Brasilonema angustatum HA4187-MV1]
MTTAIKDSLEIVWHNISPAEVARHIDSHQKDGLTSNEVAQRQERFGLNQLSSQKKKNPLWRFLLQFNQPLLYILLVAGVVTALLQDWVDAGVIFAVTLLNAIIGFIQEFKAESAIAALAEMTTTEASVIRSGQKSLIPSNDLVPGDLVVLSSGDRIPADLRLITVRDLQVDESALTGESIAVEKAVDPLESDIPLAERTNMAYAGSLVTSGRGSGLVVAIGATTEAGKISQLIDQTTDLETPLTRKIDRFSKKLLYVILVLAALTFAVGLGRGESVVDGFKAAVALVVSAIPEGLPTIITITLAIGVSRMARRHAIIRKLPAVEALGSTTVICSDKTGTLTQNQMTVQDIFISGKHYVVSGVGYASEGEILLNEQPVDVTDNSALYECLLAGLLCNDAHIQQQDGQQVVAGDPTEGALIVVARKAGLSQSAFEREMPRVDAIPFESQFQYMATLHEINSDKVIYVKGSVEAILHRCERMLDTHGKVTHLDSKQVEQQVNAMAQKGLRVLAFAKKLVRKNQHSVDHSDINEQLIFLGLQGMIDPPRPEAITAVKACKSRGIQVKMITGDHALTADAIAQKIGIKKTQILRVFTGQELARMNQQQLAQVVEDSMVFARVAPEQKLQLVEALQSKGEIVAMTGDGVNDAPALRQADIGIAMGITGTEVAKEASDMILTDDNFASIEAAIEEGRTIYQNLLKAIAFILPINGGEAMTILIGMFFAATLPIIPVQILWLNMVSGVALCLPLAFEPKSPNVKRLSPRNPNEPLLSGSLLKRVLTVSILNWIVIFGVYEWILQTTGNTNLARTMAINALVAAEIFYLLGISQFLPSVVAKLRGKTKSIGYAPAIGIVTVVILQVLFSQWNIMNQVFDTAPLSLAQGLICLAAGLPMIVLALLLKRFAPLE